MRIRPRLALLSLTCALTQLTTAQESVDALRQKISPPIPTESYSNYTRDEATEIAFLKGMIAFDQRSTEEALKQFDIAIQSNPSFPDPHYYKALILNFLNKKEDSMNAARQAAETDPENLKYADQYFGMLLKAKGKETAMLWAKKRVEQASDKAATYLFLGSVYNAVGDKENSFSQYEKAHELDPENQSVIYNLAMVSKDLGKNEVVKSYLLKLKELAPLDWQVRQELIQAYTALGETDSANSEVETLYAWFRNKEPHPIQEANVFTREKTQWDDKILVGIEYLELRGELAVKYAIVAYDLQTKEYINRISFGSYDATTEISRSLGNIGKNERLYHLDNYLSDGGHRTLGFYKKEITYDEFRKLAIDALSGKINAISSSSSPGGK